VTTALIAYGFAILIAIVILFQMALLAGAPWGHLTMGGKYPGALPKNIRRVTLVSMLLLIGFALIVLTRAGVFMPEWQPATRVLIWFVVAYCGFGVFLHIITPSRWERIIWLPQIVLLFISSLWLALQ
jgi:hypothetical protein